MSVVTVVGAYPVARRAGDLPRGQDRRPPGRVSGRPDVRATPSRPRVTTHSRGLQDRQSHLRRDPHAVPRRSSPAMTAGADVRRRAPLVLACAGTLVARRDGRHAVVGRPGAAHGQYGAAVRRSVDVSMPASAVGGRRASRPLRFTRRGRLVITLVLTCLLSSGALAATRAAVSASGQAHALQTRVVTVEPGATLWDVARTTNPDEDPRAIVARIVDMNDLGVEPVRVGQRLVVPVSG